MLGSLGRSYDKLSASCSFAKPSGGSLWQSTDDLCHSKRVFLYIYFEKVFAFAKASKRRVELVRFANEASFARFCPLRPDCGDLHMKWLSVKTPRINTVHHTSF
jgi:hypothetical protein